MPPSTNTDFVITPKTWLDQVDKLDRTSTGLLNLVGWYGSTHKAAVWRKDSEFLNTCQIQQVKGFDPQVNNWHSSFATIEAEVLATASVLVIRLENNELLNGSLGSIAEIGLALVSAALRGQILIVSIEEGLLTSLNEPGAIAQYMMLEMSLEYLEKFDGLARFFQIHRGDNLQELSMLACNAAQQQMIACQKGINFDDFLAKRARRRQNYPLRVLLGGSGGPYADAHKKTFQKKKELLTSTYSARDHSVKVLSEGAIATAWSIPYGSFDNIGIALTMRALLSIELEFKQDADLLLLPIMTEAASKAAATEIGFLLFHALKTGQDIKIFMEPFDSIDYMCHHLKDVVIEGRIDEKFIRDILHQAGVEDNILAMATQEEVFETFEIFKALKQNDTLTLKHVKQSLLGKTELFLNADNIKRVRTLVQAHLERLSAGERFPEFFSYSNQIRQ